MIAEPPTRIGLEGLPTVVAEESHILEYHTSRGLSSLSKGAILWWSNAKPGTVTLGMSSVRLRKVVGFVIPKGYLFANPCEFNGHRRLGPPLHRNGFAILAP